MRRHVCRQRDTPSHTHTLTLFPLIQHTVGAGSPVISTSSRSLFPATTVMTFLLPVPLVSRWILGGSYREETGARLSQTEQDGTERPQILEESH